MGCHQIVKCSKKEGSAMSIMFNTISKEVTLELDVEKTAKQTWESLKTKNDGDGELSLNMNTRVPSEPRYNLRKRSHRQQQQETILLLTHEFEKLTIH